MENGHNYHLIPDIEQRTMRCMTQIAAERNGKQHQFFSQKKLGHAVTNQN